MILILVNGSKPKLITLNILLLPFIMEPWLAMMLLSISLSHELLVFTKSSLVNLLSFQTLTLFGSLAIITLTAFDHSVYFMSNI